MNCFSFAFVAFSIGLGHGGPLTPPVGPFGFPTFKLPFPFLFQTMSISMDFGCPSLVVVFGLSMFNPAGTFLDVQASAL